MGPTYVNRIIFEKLFLQCLTNIYVYLNGNYIEKLRDLKSFYRNKDHFSVHTNIHTYVCMKTKSWRGKVPNVKKYM